jgi:cytochrome P450
LPKFKKDPLGCFAEMARQFGDVVRYRGMWTTYQLNHPDHIQQVLQTNFAAYRKGRDYSILKLSLGEGLLTSEGALWQRQRKMTQAAFQSQQVASSVRVMEEQALAMLERWQQRAASREVFDIVPDLMRLTLNIVSQALFSTSLEADLDVIQQALHVGREFSVDRAWSVVRVPHQIPTRRHREHRKSMASFHAVVGRMIAARETAPENDWKTGRKTDLLTSLMDARDETGAAMSAKQLRDEVATLLTAGHETTTLALAWAMFLIATRPEMMERMADEARFLNGAAPAYEDLFKLKYTRNVAEEAMRLYPPVWAISRTAVKEDEIGGYQVAPGTEVLIFPCVTHRDPRWWPEPERFNPERFAAENAAARPRCAYLPFGAGPRTCVGLNFAMTEILVVLAMTLQRFRLELAVDPAKVEAEPSVTLRPRGGVPVRLKSVS